MHNTANLLSVLHVSVIIKGSAYFRILYFGNWWAGDLGEAFWGIKVNNVNCGFASSGMRVKIENVEK